MEVSYLVTLCSLLACMDLDYIHKYTQKYHTQTGSCTRRRCFSSHPACGLLAAELAEDWFQG